MSRVSESSSVHSINYSVGRTKGRLEDLQLKGSNLKRVQKPSDDPVGNVELLSIRSQKIDSKQYLRNSSVAKTQLSYTENAVQELTDILMKAKEIAIGQSSNLFDVDIRRGIAKEIGQMRKQAVSIGNRRLGNKYVFGGHKSLTKPFDADGKYLGDKNQTKLEVAKDFYVPVNFSGDEVFFEKKMTGLSEKESGTDDPFKKISPEIDAEESIQIRRTPAGSPETQNLKESRTSFFDDLERLENALLSDNHEIIQNILPKLDESLSRLITLRSKIGSVINSIDNAVDNTEKTMILNDEYKSKIEDADVAELFTDLTREQNVLNATYKASSQLMNRNLMDFIR